jgi:hypothetical protein
MTPTSPRRTIGLAGSSIWLASVGALFPLIALALIGTPLAWLVFAVAVLVVLGLVLVDVSIIREVRRAVAPLPPNGPVEMTMLRRFKYVVIGEIAAFWIVNTILSVLRQHDLMTPADVLIVGVHFLPLAWVFRRPHYYALGIAFCAVVVTTMSLVPATAHIGKASAWFAWIGFGCGPAAILCGIANTYEARQAVTRESAISGAQR